MWKTIHCWLSNGPKNNKTHRLLLTTCIDAQELADFTLRLGPRLKIKARLEVGAYDCIRSVGLTEQDQAFDDAIQLRDRFQSNLVQQFAEPGPEQFGATVGAKYGAVNESRQLTLLASLESQIPGAGSERLPCAAIS